MWPKLINLKHYTSSSGLTPSSSKVETTTFLFVLLPTNAKHEERSGALT